VRVGELPVHIRLRRHDAGGSLQGAHRIVQSPSLALGRTEQHPRRARPRLSQVVARVLQPIRSLTQRSGLTGELSPGEVRLSVLRVQVDRVLVRRSGRLE
jgi:hypothetical protein